MSEINKERVALLVEALESGKYEQAGGRLARLDASGVMRHCCLGVACEVAMAAGVPLEIRIDEEGSVKYDDWVATLPRIVREWYGVAVSDPIVVDHNGQRQAASKLNDEGQPFPQIAAAFRRTYLACIVNPRSGSIPRTHQ